MAIKIAIYAIAGVMIVMDVLWWHGPVANFSVNASQEAMLAANFIGLYVITILKTYNGKV